LFIIFVSFQIFVQDIFRRFCQFSNDFV